jgi:hypothetical protein
VADVPREDAVKAKAVLDVIQTIGILLGLLFVGLEIRQNTNAVKGTTVQSIAEMSFEATLAVSQDDELAEAYRLATQEGVDSLTSHQVMILASFTAASLRIVETRFRQVSLGILGEDELLIAGGASSFYRTEWFAYWWDLVGRGDASPDFAAWVESDILGLS